jgi:hypothetical protein
VSEDTYIRDLRILDQNQREFRNEEAVSLYSLLTTDKQPVFIKLNDNLHLFPGVQKHVPDVHIDDHQWFKKCQAKGLSATHSTTLTTFIT